MLIFLDVRFIKFITSFFFFCSASKCFLCCIKDLSLSTVRGQQEIFNRRQIWTTGRLRKGYAFEQVQFWIYLVWLRESPVCGLRYCIQIPQVSNITKCCRTTYHQKKTYSLKNSWNKKKSTFLAHSDKIKIIKISYFAILIFSLVQMYVGRAPRSYS